MSSAYAIDRKVGQSGQDRAKVAANRDFESSAGFGDREYRRDAGCCFLTADVYPIKVVICGYQSLTVGPSVGRSSGVL